MFDRFSPGVCRFSRPFRIEEGEGGSRPNSFVISTEGKPQLGKIPFNFQQVITLVIIWKNLSKAHQLLICNLFQSIAHVVYMYL